MTTSQKHYFHTDENDYFVTSTPADPHPILEGEWMPPPFRATMKPIPATIPQNKWPKLVNDTWILVDSFKGTEYWVLEEGALDYAKHVISEHEVLVPEGGVTVDPGVTIQRLKYNKLSQLTIAYNQAKYSDIRYVSDAGVTRLYQTSPVSRDSLKDATTSFASPNDVPEGYYWRSSDNQNTPFTYNDLIALSNQIANRDWILFDHYQGYKDQLSLILSLDDREELDAIVWVPPL